MCDFNNLTDKQKEQYHEQLTEYAQLIGGTALFLQLLEGIREAVPHPLTAANREFSLNGIKLKWNKVIFNDKLQLLRRAHKNANINEKGHANLLPKIETKDFKKILNTLKTIKPIIFTVMPARREDGDGFIFQPLVRENETETRLNFIFEVLFFCSVDNAKSILNYKVKN